MTLIMTYPYVSIFIFFQDYFITVILMTKLVVNNLGFGNASVPPCYRNPSKMYY